MIPGPTIIRKCSVCSKSIKQHTIESGNTFDAIFWTDGKREAPMLPDQPRLIMCPHCHAPLWIDELEEIGEIDPWEEMDDRFKAAIEYKMPSLDDYYTLLEQGLATSEKKRYVHLHTWWAENDVRRTNTGEIPISARESSNLIAFAQLLDESNSHDLVRKSEVMRELGHFGDSIALLTKSTDNDISQAVTIIKNLAEQGDPYVREMNFE